MNFKQIKDQIKANAGYLQSRPGAEIDTTISNYVNSVYQGLSSKDDWHWWLARMQYTVVVGQTAISLPQDFSNILQLRDSNNRNIPVELTREQSRYANARALFCTMPSVALDVVHPFTVYSTGTIALPNGDATATLSGGTWPADVAGRSFNLVDDPEQFVVASRTSDTVVELDHARIGASVTAGAFRVDKAGSRRLRISPSVLEAGIWTLHYYFVPPAMVADTDEPILPLEFHRYMIEAVRESMLLNATERAALIQAGNLESQDILMDMRKMNRAQTDCMDLDIEAYA